MAHGPVDVRADLTIGADGRHSTIRDKSGLKSVNLGAPMDVLWMKLGHRSEDPKETFGRFDPGRILVLIDRGDYWQCGFVIRKGGFDELQSAGLEAFRNEIARLVPFLAERVNELASWEDVRLLTVAVDRLVEWQRPGLLCIGDAAHAMSPIGGVGVNLAIQDAVAAANMLATPLRRGVPELGALRAVQRRREWPARITQFIQLFIQSRIITGVLASASAFTLPLPLRLLRDHPFLRRLPACFIGLGILPEHLKNSGTPPG
jgi:2-polyprenyl-6-methoxyphenol hydroxylase-like FAD-dependent oxidoreductase